ncbi:MAG: ATP-binding cassette domain-containing protein [Anaerolineaceae bacterium]|nr:ATP-binding cassette domain-containing protein [Anaerolineaceae bacterium]
MFQKFKKKEKEVAEIVQIEEPSPGAGIVQICNLYKSYETAAGEFPVLKNLNIDIQPGEFVGIIGKSGSGKSTLINMIAGIDHPTAGAVFVDDTSVHGMNESEMSKWRGRNMGIVFQFFQLLPMLSVLENVMLPMDFCNVHLPRERKEKALEMLDMVEMVDHANKLPSAVSGGQQQRVAIARALANNPPVIVADEPTGNLDSHTAEAVFGLFEMLVNQGKTIMMVTHDNSLARRVTRTILLADGELVNEWLLRAMPTLSHPQMLKATKAMEPLSFAAGQKIVKENEINDRFYIITEGFVNIALNKPGSENLVVNRMGPGEYFGEVELMNGGHAIATITAAEIPVKVISMERALFEELLNENRDTKKVIEAMVSRRVNENKTARSKK